MRSKGKDTKRERERERERESVKGNAASCLTQTEQNRKILATPPPFTPKKQQKQNKQKKQNKTKNDKRQ